MILPEIAAAYGRSEDTLAWWRVTRDEWPAPVGKRGRWDEYDPAQVEAAIHSILAVPGSDEADPDELLDMKAIAAEAGVAYATARVWATPRNGKPAKLGPPDDDQYGVKRWKRATVRQAVAGMRPHKRRGAAGTEAAPEAAGPGGRRPGSSAGGSE